MLCNYVTTASNIMKNMASYFEPCDDFYKFSCGGFSNSAFIPNDKLHVQPLSIVNDAVKKQLRTSIMEGSPNKTNEIRPFKLVRDFYKACMNKSK